ncbi:MAG: roadblock/LC7 domain-containing protein [Candidatus Hodarchaeota archaeon]
MNKTINQIVDRMCQSVPGLYAALVLDDEGIPLAKVLPGQILRDESINESLINTMIIKASKGASWVSEKLVKGSLDFVIMKTSNGTVFIREMSSKNPNIVDPMHIIVLADSLIPIELALLHIEKLRRQIAKIV